MSNTTNISLAGSPGVSQVSELHSTILEAVIVGSAVTLDFSDTQDFDTSVLQLAIATRVATQQHESPTALTGVSDGLARTLENHGASFLLTPTEVGTKAKATESQAE